MPYYIKDPQTFAPTSLSSTNLSNITNLPKMTELVPTSEIIESIFATSPHLRPETSKYDTSARTKVLSTLRMLPLIGRVLPSADEKAEEIARLLVEQKEATSYKAWYRISARLDELTGNNTWKLSPESVHYDYDLVYENMMLLRNARINKDYRLLIYLIRTRWTRNFANMGDLNLYRHSHVGTKRLIEEYIDECQESLHWLVTNNDVNLDDRYLLGMLIQTRKNIGRTALLLSGGSTFGISHIGVLIALMENNLVPRIISGSSSGSIIASILCCHSNEEIQELLLGIADKNFGIFSKVKMRETTSKLKFVLERISHFLKFGTFYDISGLQDTIYNFVGDLTFREAYNRTGKILNITVSPATMHEQTRLLNYLTAPNCLIWSAVCASCSLPGIFPSTTIYEKSPRTNEIHEWNNDNTSKFVDGSLDGDLPIARLSEMFNVDHIIAVQVNPHVSPILNIALGNIGGKLDSELKNTMRGLMNDCYDFVTNEMVHYLQVLHQLNLYKNLTLKVVSILSQKYSGDITILPELNVKDFLKIFQNPTPEFLLEFILKGARAAWPKITVINNHCRVEFALDKEISYLRGRLVFSGNKRLTYPEGESTRSNSTLMRQGESNVYLISSPVLNSDNESEAPTRPAGIRRYKSHSNGSTAAGDRSPNMSSIRKKRNSFSGSQPSKAVHRGQSMTSLQALKTNFNSITSEIASAVPNSDATIAKLFEDGYDINFGSYSEPQTAVVKKPMRKARSSGNFHSQTESEQEDGPANVFSFRTSPKFDKTIHFGLDYDNFANKFPGGDKVELSKEKANLPRLSKPNSVRTSYVGLNRLKDQMKSNKSSSTNTAANSSFNSNRNSSQNLRELYTDKELASKVLDSPKLHRYFAKLRPGVVTNMTTPVTPPKVKKSPKVSFSSLANKDSESDKMETSEETDENNSHGSDHAEANSTEADADDGDETEREDTGLPKKLSFEQEEHAAEYFPYN